ncbi:cyclopropane-fatty-acyl-phospholipid synthase [Hasllibacter halocynthiae]|uniref:Cyclopropane-fatty-acyl-phospholipid synthase n=1 Tax=Hasllibacter halocynthiae TaxID=595589 RepID=A0A2T0X0V9_9RHOB|nr:cyclopropane-fatty-acyl-phospholipid synthase family protein [Hasllibacter halocynthiae]PRY92571.1 cyclopropane-fatty-acyl-phospholipid synthase [Hasllibacter halocynthiae]
MWKGLLDAMLRRALKTDALEVRFPDGAVRRYGPPGAGEPAVAIAFHDPALPRRLVRNADLALGEAYMDGALTVERGCLRDFLAIAVRAGEMGDDVPAFRVWRGAAMARRRAQQLNPPGRARRNVAHHYDLSGALYELFLDEDRQYSCAYFARPDMTLDEAQAAKKAHIARKLLIEPGMRVLDIGCGWGGLALTLARDHGARVTGITLSEEQHAHARARVEAAGLSGRIDIRLQDFRAVTGRFDRIVSVGMFEHVGLPAYRAYFAKVGELLDPGGVALIHTIGRTDTPGITSPFIAKWIFPGGYVPALTEMLAPVQRQRLVPCDLEIWRLHYAETLRHWLERFDAHAAEAEALYDARFVRMWRFYLAACEMSFRHHRLAVFQLQLAHRKDAVPITRDYLYGDAAAAPSPARAGASAGSRAAAE